jgi:16S rRNA (cytosine967-C5)-methyltransferase
VLVSVLVSGRSLTWALERAFPTDALSPKDQAFARALAYGTIRFEPLLGRILEQKLRQPLTGKRRIVHLIALLGLYQCYYTRTPDHALVSTSLALAQTLGAGWAKGLLNGVLRGVIRQRDALMEAVQREPVGRFAHPQWWIDRVSEAWPEHFERILDANNDHPPLTLRVNRLRTTRESLLQQFAEASVSAAPITRTDGGVVLSDAGSITLLPGYEEGLWAVQDEAAQRMIDALPTPLAGRILDACAAPGGKTGHLCEAALPDCEVVAIDNDGDRAARLHTNLQRLGHNATVLTADASQPDQWWDGRAFDVVVLDAPCSGSGVIRRHPDIKLLRRETDISMLCRLQARLLDALWTVLKPGGCMVYVTCSILPAENAKQIERFVEARSDAVSVERYPRFDPAWSIETHPGVQILPGMGSAAEQGYNGMDGFYFALLHKT